MWVEKALRWFRTQRSVLRYWEEALDGYPEDVKRVWFHVASAGEFEQVVPVIEELRKRASFLVIITHFSPSGEQIYRYLEGMGCVYGYLPAPVVSIARKWLSLVNPCIAVFVKYEHWLPYLRACKEMGIPVISVAQYYSEYPRGLRKIFLKTALKYYSLVTVQDEFSRRVVSDLGALRVKVTGDPRVDRVLSLVRAPKDYPGVKSWCAGRFVVVAGSTYAEEHEMILEVYRRMRWVSWIVAPHEITNSVIRWWKEHVPEVILFSELMSEKCSRDARVVLVDGYGHLKYLYRFGRIAFVGGGFRRQIHSVLEPFAWNLPVVTGPRISKFREAVAMAGKGLFVVEDTSQLMDVIERLSDDECYERARRYVEEFMRSEMGASVRTVEAILEDVSIC